MVNLYCIYAYLGWEKHTNIKKTIRLRHTPHSGPGMIEVKGWHKYAKIDITRLAD